MRVAQHLSRPSRTHIKRRLGLADTHECTLHPLWELCSLGADRHVYVIGSILRTIGGGPASAGDIARVAELAFRDGIWEQIRLREPRFHEHAYLFVLRALEFQQEKLSQRRHLDGRELASAVRDLALEKFGVMARLVLEHWGVRSTADVGDIVFTMVDLGLLMSQPTDSRLDFVDVYEFDQAFEVAYPWSAAHLA